MKTQIESLKRNRYYGNIVKKPAIRHDRRITSTPTQITNSKTLLAKFRPVSRERNRRKKHPTVTNKDGTGGLSRRVGQRDVASTPPLENVLISKCFFNGRTKELLYFKNSRRLRRQHGLSPQPFILAIFSLAFSG